ncbi:MAG: hypothetical protein V3575_01900 [Candidatus Absconditabacteria bacterium]
MNSYHLKSKFKDYYQSFFSRNSLVVSLPTSLTLFGGTACIFGGIILKQKISQRLYLGINVTGDKSININSNDYFDYKKGKILSHIENKYLNIGQELKQTIFNEYNIGINIEIFSEFEWKDSDLIIAGIILSLDLITKKIDYNKIEFIKNNKYEELLNDNYFKEFIHKALKYRLIFNDSVQGGSSLSSIFTGISDGKFPVLNMIKKRIESPFTKFSSGKKKLLIDIEKEQVEYNTFRLSELIESEYYKSLPFDFMIFSIDDYINDNWFQSTLNWMEDSIEFKDKFKKKTNKLQDFYLEKFNKNEILNNNIETIVNFEFALLKVFIDTILSKSKIDKLFYFLDRNIELIKSLLGKQNIVSNCIEKENMYLLGNLVSNIYPKIGKDEILIYTTSQSNDNKYVVLIPKELQTIEIEDIKKEIKSIFGERSGLIFSSKNYGIEENGIIIEQDIYNGKNSEYTEGKYYIKGINNIIEIGNHESLIKNFNGILFDTVTQKIFINGNKITSKQLVSQSSTVEIMKILIENIGTEISNHQLPLSSYSKSRNDIIGKIIMPLQNLVRNELNKNLDIICKGSITEFNLLLKPTKINIGILKSN